MQHPLKKRKLTREFSINTVLQRVGSKEPPLADCAGRAPQTVQEIVPPLFTGGTPKVSAAGYLPCPRP